MTDLTKSQLKMLVSLADEPRAPTRANPVALFLVQHQLAKWVGIELHITAEGEAELWKRGIK